ncbi:MAG: periplasmic sensor signal transduction histidine kinase [Polaromonas sp.]|nr:periplasmic sensor signal transduction histidine kinase [Polaromonas sp.]
MSDPALSVFPVIGPLVAFCLAWWAVQQSGQAWMEKHELRDLAFTGCAAAWMLHLLTATLLGQVAATDAPGFNLRLTSVYTTYLGYQAVILATCFFLLICSGVTRSSVYGLLAVQAMAGACVLVWQQGQVHPLAQLVESRYGIIRPSEHSGWIAANVSIMAVSLAAMARRVYTAGTVGAWLALAAGVVGCSFFLEGIQSTGDTAPFASLPHYAYAFFLLIVWRLAAQPAMQASVSTLLRKDFEASSAFESITGFDIAGVAASTAVASERRRIAQELHDGVGSQIVSILSSLDHQMPQQQEVFLALEQCLIDLKMTVDAIDSEDDNLLDALGRLRYRVQHSLDRLGIQMVWTVEISHALEAVRGMQAQQALRITQEGLANVMRHSRASQVTVACRVRKDTHHLMLEISDNGNGLARKGGVKRMGKGIEGMIRRARDAGGHLRISSKPGLGTCLTLMVPLGSERPKHVLAARREPILAS